MNGRPSEQFTTFSEFIGYMVDRVTDVKPLYGYNKSFKLWAEVDSDDDRQQQYVLGTTHLGQGTDVVGVRRR